MAFLGLRWGWLLVVPLAGVVFLTALGGGGEGVGVLSALIMAYLVVRAGAKAVSRVRRRAGRTDERTTSDSQTDATES